MLTIVFFVTVAAVLIIIYLTCRVYSLSSWKESNEGSYRRLLQESDQRVQRASEECLARDARRRWYVTPPIPSADPPAADALAKVPPARAEPCENILMTGPSGPHPCPGEGHRLVVVGDHVVCACQGVPVEIK
jgi:hypothetical protein